MIMVRPHVRSEPCRNTDRTGAPSGQRGFDGMAVQSKDAHTTLWDSPRGKSGPPQKSVLLVTIGQNSGQQKADCGALWRYSFSLLSFYINALINSRLVALHLGGA